MTRKKHVPYKAYLAWIRGALFYFPIRVIEHVYSFNLVFKAILEAGCLKQKNGNDLA